MTNKEITERLGKLEAAIFNLAIAIRRLDLLQKAGFEISIIDAEGNELKQTIET